MPVKTERLPNDVFQAAFGTENTVRREAEKYIAQAKADKEARDAAIREHGARVRAASRANSGGW